MRFNNKYYTVIRMMKQLDKRYQSVLKLVNLPRTRHLKYPEQKIFKQQKFNQQDIKLVSNQLKLSRQHILNTIYKQVQIFDDVNYQFKFPTSNLQFTNSNMIIKPQKNQFNLDDQQNFGHKLNQQQLYQISQKGQFQVKSNNQRGKLPITWKVNDCLVRGSININKIWQNGLGSCYSFLIDSWQNVKTTIPKCLSNIAKLPLRLIDIILGIKSINKIYTPDYHREVVKDFWSDIMQNQLNNVSKIIGRQFLELLQIKWEDKYSQDIQIRKQRIGNLKNYIIKIQTQFNKNWNYTKQNTLEIIQKQNPHLALNSQPIQQKYKQQKLKCYLQHIRKQPPIYGITNNQIQGLIIIIHIINQINQKIKIKQQYLTKLYENIRQKIISKYPIKSKQYTFLQQILSKQYQEEKIKYQQIFYNQLLNHLSLNNLFNHNYQSIYRKYLKFRQFYHTLIQQKKNNMICFYQPTRIFRTSYPLLPPYQSYTKNLQGRTHYYLKKQQKLTSDTSHHFWKCSLYWMRITSWTLNWIITLIGIAWVGPFGLRCLCGTQSFQYDYNCDSGTGRKIPQLRETVLVKFMNVLQSIRKSRQQFQSQPDRGLLGKNFSRICNLIQCYFFMLLIVGVIGVLILYPILILLSSVLSVILILTFWFWIPVGLIGCYLFNTFIFQFEISQYGDGCLIRSIPLLSIILRVLWNLLLILISIFTLLLTPILCVLYICFLVVQRFIRKMFDNIMVCIISWLGRTPTIDTFVAKKISGPGMSTNYFNKISENNVYLLVQSELQKIFFDKFISLTKQKIYEKQRKYRASLRYLLNPFNYSQPNLNHSLDIVEQSTRKLLQNFDTKAQKYKDRYPENPYNVRFNHLQLQKYFDNSTRIVKNYVQKQKIYWIFQQNKVPYQDYHELTRVLWKIIFSSSDIFQPIQQLDQRLMVDKNVTSNSNQFQRNMHFIQDTLRGQIPHSIEAVNIGTRQLSILEKESQLNIITTICDLHDKNSGVSIFIDLSNPSCLMIPPRNLQQIKRYDKQAESDIRINANLYHKKLIQLNY